MNKHYYLVLYPFDCSVSLFLKCLHHGDLSLRNCRHKDIEREDNDESVSVFENCQRKIKPINLNCQLQRNLGAA